MASWIGDFWMGPADDSKARIARTTAALMEMSETSETSGGVGMGAFNINITGVGGHGCERKAQPGEKLHGRCGRFTCPDCMAYEFVQRMKQAGMLREGEQATGQELQPGEAAPAGADVYYTDRDGRITRDPQSDSRRFWKKPQQALFTHWPDSPTAVVDDMLKNERQSGQF